MKTLKTRLALPVIAAWLFLPPVFFPSAQAQGPAADSQYVSLAIDRFDVDPPKRLLPGEALIFRITGSSNGEAAVRIGGVKGKIGLKEVMPGVYEGAYTIRPGDEIVGDSLVIGYLRRSNRELSAVLDQPLVEPGPVATLNPIRRASWSW